VIRRLNLAGIAMALHSRNYHPTPSALSAPLKWIRRRPYIAGVAAVAGAPTVSAVTNHLLARRAERRNPPSGHFVDSNGVRLHYIDRGDGPPLVLLHGNGSMIDDFETSGLIDLAARHHRVIVFDRPGYGHSTRPRSRIWSVATQAKLIHDALDRIGVSRAVVLGHSWGRPSPWLWL
jgi:hypothetical protein